MIAESLNNVYLPDGEYVGRWSGYRVEIKLAGNDSYVFTTKTGIRTIYPIDVNIKINSNKAIISA